MENIYVRDYEELLDGQLLADYWVNGNYNEVPEDYEGEKYPMTRHYRHVYITGGSMYERYGGPEEGGWWYEAYDPEIDVELTVTDEKTLRHAISHVQALLFLRHPDSEYGDLAIYISTDGFYRKSYQRYE